MSETRLINSNPTIFDTTHSFKPRSSDFDESIHDLIDEEEIFELIRNINDPEHPLTLEQLNVVQIQHINITNDFVLVEFTPTIPHCSMATLIGLSIRVRLLHCLPKRFRVKVMIRKGTHQSEDAVNKQLADKERVAAALENTHLVEVVNQCISRTLKENNDFK
ncbi:hypothetical protein ROZALSC1DRAFT_15761 [Rozella allomycis CSF55]|uniref:MIP18 family-like domain-containing protein n=1 Tax=Rozella allomycis (strain CSF55) TaxID=988480 RepID=A0A4P9YFK2_ROZAC|nr:hypothetical protein ROZALSC1DRAFT_15761 [Rozella allomycis CSF55]